MTEQTADLVHKYSENGITTLTLNQPEKKNSLSMAMLEALSEELNQKREKITKNRDLISGVRADLSIWTK